MYNGIQNNLATYAKAAWATKASFALANESLDFIYLRL